MLERMLHERERKERVPAKNSILIVDADRSLQNDDKLSISELKQRALKENIDVCLQHPNLEGLLLRMLPNNEQLQPNSTTAKNKLIKAWPDYKKPADARALASKLSLNDLQRVAKFDNDLKNLLDIIGLNDFRN